MKLKDLLVENDIPGLKLPHEMSREEFCTPPELPVASEGNVIVYHALSSDSDLDSVLAHGLLTGKKGAGHEGPSNIIWGTFDPEEYSRVKTVVGVEVPLSQLENDKPVGHARIIGDVPPSAIVYVDRPGYCTYSSGQRISKERSSSYAGQYHDVYMADRKR